MGRRHYSHLITFNAEGVGDLLVVPRSEVLQEGWSYNMPPFIAMVEGVSVDPVPVFLGLLPKPFYCLYNHENTGFLCC